MTAIDTANQEKKKLEEDGATQANDILGKSREELLRSDRKASNLLTARSPKPDRISKRNPKNCRDDHGKSAGSEAGQ